jgi:hypothetical protein
MFVQYLLFKVQQIKDQSERKQNEKFKLMSKKIKNESSSLI